jgi:phosphoglycolate phosphatase
MQALGYPKQDDLTIRRQVGWGDKNLLKPFMNLKDLKKALYLYRRHHKESLLKHSHLFPYVKNVLSCLKGKGFKLAVASNRPTKFSWILIRHLGLNKYFGYVLCADKLKHAKPHPEIINKIMRRFSVKPNETVYVGDMAIDAEAGRRARVATIIVTTGSSAIVEIKKEKPQRIIRRITELLKIL